MTRRLVYLIFGAALAIGIYMIWQGFFNPATRWRAIVIHHSASNSGNLGFFKRLHTEERGWPDVAYHFVINNGTMGKQMGEIEVSDLWKNQKGNYSTTSTLFNMQSIAIVLVGNFEKYKVPPRQYAMLVELVTALALKYNIQPGEIYAHKQINETKCPGRLLDIELLKENVYRKMLAIDPHLAVGH